MSSTLSVGSQAAKLGEVAEELAPGRGEVAAADEREPAGRDQLTAAAQPVEQISRGEEDPPRERLRQVEGPIPHRYSNGSDSATSASVGAEVSRAESSGSETPHSTPTSGSFQAMPVSVAGS